MSLAVKQLLTTLDNLEEIANELGTALIGKDVERSKSSLQLNGMHVVAFATLEDFFRRRTYDVICSIGKLGVKFDDLPNAFRAYILEQTIEGLSFSISKTDSSSRITTLQLQGLLIGATGDGGNTFEPSEYFFGRSQSNISVAQVKLLLEAMTVAGGWQCLSDIAARAGQAHLGSPDQIFHRLAQNRHSAAHGFNKDYKISEFLSDVRFGARVLAFAFDTCLCQWAYKLKQAALKNEVCAVFKAQEFDLWNVEFDPTKDVWIETRNAIKIKEVRRRDFAVRLARHKTLVATSGFTMVKLDAQGKIDEWFQPID